MLTVPDDIAAPKIDEYRYRKNFIIRKCLILSILTLLHMILISHNNTRKAIESSFCLYTLLSRAFIDATEGL